MCFLSYVLAGLVAAGDAFAPSLTIVGVVPDLQIHISTWAIATMSVLGLAGVIARRWRMEWIAASVLVFLLGARALPVWVSIDEVPTRLSAAAAMTLGALGVGRRALDCWVFHVNTVTVARTHRRMERRRAARRAEGRP
ncbi:hypothetical protein [Cellulomonas palmilytica]|uniref:hypothetical protein n=1 Tax=Cellulomonas palmilytica TaxID=2608402 RepID=UPI001F3962B1|nr:hypothetical protein [Cellulomonas palmilytica]UJP39319.1 hypothetical protein F1D97_13365 [Cellulomonas palmilytica]